MHLFCFGLGYSSMHLARSLLKKGWRVSGTTRDAHKVEKLRSSGVTAYIFDDGLPLQEIWDFSSVTHILHSIPPKVPDIDIVHQYHLGDIEKIPDLKWFGYLSTTGVYGDHQGQWVDEMTPVNPVNDRGHARVFAEKLWLNGQVPASIYRLSGIYGEGRSSIDSLKQGKARRINKPGQFFSRIHVEDIVQVLESAMNKENIAGQIYNLSDDLPASQSDVVAYAAKIASLPCPDAIDFDSAELSEMARSFYMSNRRVRNSKIKEQLIDELIYPSYKEGLASIHKKLSTS